MKAISLLICALGGEGGGVLTEWLMEAARHAGYPAQSTSIPGVAQRTGATTYYLEVFPQTLANLGGHLPVLNLNPVPGALDCLISSELLEGARQASLGLPSPDRTLLICSSARTLTTEERMPLGDGRADDAQLLALLQAASRDCQVLDMVALAKQAGTMVSAVMLGAIAGSGLLPFAKESYAAAIGNGGSAAASLRGFDAGFAAIQSAATARQQASAQGLAAAATSIANTDLLPKKEQTIHIPQGFSAENLQEFAAAARATIALGCQRMVEYQGLAYAKLYLQRLHQVAQAEDRADPGGQQAGAITEAMARWLALWMAFDDIARVADLKCRADRWQRLRGETKARADELLKIYDHFKPGVAEFAALLPNAMARRLTAWEQRRVASGKPSLALPLKVGRHTVLGMLALRSMAALKHWRPYGSRYAHEQALISQWLDAVLQATERDWQLGLEVARCGQLIKGYGSTNERGKNNLLHIIQHLLHIDTDPNRCAQAVAAARSAALQDEAGSSLNSTLAQWGAPAKPVAAQPIHWHPRRPSGTRSA